jgi:hypothetical protein
VYLKIGDKEENEGGRMDRAGRTIGKSCHRGYAAFVGIHAFIGVQTGY